MTKRRRLVAAFIALAAGGCSGGDKDPEPVVEDQDADGYSVGDGDCDDGDARVHPGAEEVCDDGLDNDCDGEEAVCDDGDGDGYAAVDDCDDDDPEVNPGAFEECDDGGIDDNCDGVALECFDPSLTYAPLDPGRSDSLGNALYGDYVVFGDPSGVPGEIVGDGTAVFFRFDTVGEVTRDDAALTSPGEAGGNGAYGSRIAVIGEWLAVTSESFGAGGADNAGKSWLFDADTVAASGAVLDPTAALITVESTEENAFAGVDALLDVDGDGLDDLIVSGARGTYAILGDQAGFSGDYRVPEDAGVTFDLCASSTDDDCGRRRAYLPNALAIGGGLDQAADEIAIYALPVASSRPAPAATYVGAAGFGQPLAGMAALPLSGVFAVGEVRGIGLFDVDGNEVGALELLPLDVSFPQVASVVNGSGHELLLLTNPIAGNPLSGDILGYNVSVRGFPQFGDQPDYWLRRPATTATEACGVRISAGHVGPAEERRVLVTTSCLTFGGAAYDLGPAPEP